MSRKQRLRLFPVVSAQREVNTVAVRSHRAQRVVGHSTEQA